MRTYEVRMQVMVERTIYVEVDIDNDELEDGSYELEQELSAKAEEFYWNNTLSSMDFNEETHSIELENYQENSL